MFSGDDTDIVLKFKWNSRTCRICLQSGPSKDLFVCDPGMQISFAERAMRCTSLTISKHDNLPNRICLQCIGELEVADRFRKKCYKSNDILTHAKILDGTEDKLIEKQPAPVSVPVAEEMENMDEIVIQVEPDVLYSFKPPSGLNVKVIPGKGESPLCSIDHDPVISDSDTEEEAFNDLISYSSSVIGDISIESLEDEEAYIDETVLVSATNMLTPKTPTKTAHNCQVSDNSFPGEIAVNLDMPAEKTVRTLRTIRKTNAPNELRPTVETVITQAAADGNGTETVIRVKRNLSGAPRHYACNICNATFKQWNSLDTHMRRHRNDRPHKCEHCGKGFVVPFELQRHMRIHTGYKPYKCQYCDRAYADFGSKKKHERTHTGERPYECPVCRKKFSYSHVLSDHLLIHTGEKKFRCTTCDKRFPTAQRLRNHERTHLTTRTRESKKNGTSKLTDTVKLLADSTGWTLSDETLPLDDETDFMSDFV
ncbi:zinc finger protein 184-like isoform X2 [Anopheles coustani]|uniref:zinc finger protein 184-like isoform X2 n=1 Tax=Anopheles coustani TaxID=139045 RepID=UPI00265825F4|nr:zinc finger protein 184-like isoform X2 [Anopheles coustani]